jgi:FG-GAP-like repeat/FG-GAP repeat
MAQLSLQASFALPTPAEPVGAAAGDFTGDGYVDVAITASGTDEVRVMVGNGLGFLLPGPIFTTGSQTNPGDLRSIDVDGDGDLDLAVCLRNAGKVAFYRNNGTGIFTPLGSFTTGLDSMGPDVGDVDHDGDLDLVVANRGAGTVSVLRNIGTTFVTTSFATADDPRGAAFGDFDDDGDLDVAATSNTDRTVLLFRNDGASFAPMMVLDGPSGMRPRAIRCADLNSDGTADIVIASDDDADSAASIFLRTGAGFAAPQNYASGGSAAGYLSLNDFECDGDIDIALVNEGSESVALFANSGTGTFANPMLVPTGITPAAITSADIDGDNDIDLVLSNTDADSMTVVLLGCGQGGGSGGPVCGNGTCEPNENPRCIDCQGGGTVLPPGSFAFDHDTVNVDVPFGAVTIDIDGDGDNDIVVASDFPESLRVLTNDGSGLFTQTASYPLPYYSIPSEVVKADFNNDGIEDVAVALFGTSGIKVFRGTGTGLALAETIPTGLQPVGLCVGDADADGWVDIAAASADSGTVTFGRNDDGNWQFHEQVLAVGGDPAGAAFVDIGGDGSSELAVTSTVNQNIRVFEMFGSDLALVTTLDVGAVVSAAALDSGDVNGDGFGDLVAAAHSFGDPENGCIVWTSNGSSLDNGIFYEGGGSIPLYLELADLDCDGSPEITLSNSNSDNITVLVNTGSGAFGAPVAFLAESAPMPITSGDINGDNIADLVVANVNSESLSLFVNLSCGLGPAADLTGDGLVDGSDLAVLLGAWGTAAADLTGDGTTDAADLAMLLGAWA